MGSASCQTHVVVAPLVTLDIRTPLATAVSPAGTAIAKSKVALSCGLSLQGNQPGEPCGSPTLTAPSSVGTQPSIDWSGSVTTVGVPRYPTITVKLRPASKPAAGVMISSWPSRVNVAAAPLTSR